MHTKVFIAGIGTNAGKTQAAAYLVNKLRADYWKPIECGLESDTTRMHSMINAKTSCIHPPAYSFKTPVSPHRAAELEGVFIDVAAISPPKTARTLIIETAGGILSPLTYKKTNLDLFSTWNGTWIVVTRHYLGSINHTLLTINALKKSKAHITGIIVYGKRNLHSEDAIISLSGVPILCYLKKT